MTNKEKILVIKLGALGDFIQALGPMAAIRKHHPGAHISLMTTAPYEALAKKCGYFDEIWIDRRPRWHQLKIWSKLKRRLNAEGFTRIYDLQNNDRTALYFKTLNSPKPEWVGAAKGASHENSNPQRTKGHAFDGHVQTLALSGIRDISIDTLDWMDESISSFPLRKPYVLIVPGSAPEHPQKRWPAEEYGRLCKILSSSGYQPVVIGTKAEKKAVQEIVRHCPEVLDLTGQTTLGHIAALGRGAAGAIGNDTGPVHMIAATSCPVLALFSAASNPAKHTPKGENVKILQRENLSALQSEEVLAAFAPRHEPARKSRTLH